MNSVRRVTLGLGVIATTVFTSSTPRVSAVRSEVSTSTITIDSQPFAIRSSGTYAFRVVLPQDVQGATSIRVQLHRRATSRESVRVIAEGGTELRTIDDTSFSISSLNRFQTRGVVIPVELQLGGVSTALNLPFPGVFPVTISALQGSTAIASVRTFISYAETTTTASAAVATSIVLAPEYVPSRTPEGELAISATTRNSLQRLVDVLEKVRSAITLQLQPETISALAESDNPNDTALLNSLATALQGHTLLATTYVPLDPSSAAAAGLANEFTRQLRLGETALRRDLPQVRLSRSTWITHDPLTTEGASLLRDLGITSVVLLAPKTSGMVNEKPAGLSAHITLPDDTLMAALTADSGTTKILDDPLHQDALSGIRIAAELVAERQDLLTNGANADDIKLVIATSSGEVPGIAAINSLISALQTTPEIVLTDFANGVSALQTSPAVIPATTPARDLSTIGTAIFSIAIDRVAIGSMLPDDSVEPALWDKMIAILPASTIDDSTKYVTGVRQLMRAVKLGVTPPAPSTFTLGERRANIRIQIRNTSTSTLKVRVTLTSAKLLFPEAPPIVELSPNASTDVVVPVIARSNGRFPVTVRITTPVGNARVTAPVVLTARVNIIAGLGQIISFCALGLLLLWWAVSWRRSRRRREATTVGLP